MEKILVLASGGLDSTVLLYKAVRNLVELVELVSTGRKRLLKMELWI